MTHTINCPVTDLIPRITGGGTYNNSSENYFEYQIVVDNKPVDFRIDEGTYESKILPFINQNKNILKSLYFNNKFPKAEIETDNHILQLEDFERFLKEANYPKTFEEKLMNFFLQICKVSRHDGDYINTNLFRNYHKYYLLNEREFYFYMAELRDRGLISAGESNFYITSFGINERNKILNEGDNSTRCFVAMSFDKENRPIFSDAIKPICDEYGFQAIRVDFLHPQSENTINDLIVAELKKCKFCIADFTNLKAGVYFEAGYALGRGKKVIYTCSKKDFEKLHFDINHYPILIYETLDELKYLLRNKIEAFILE